MNKHIHKFDEGEWPFDDPINAIAITTIGVIEKGLPALIISHDQDGDWQVLCGTTTETEDARIVCLGCAYQRDKTIGEMASLPRGWRAWREFVGGPWEKERKEIEGYE